MKDNTLDSIALFCTWLLFSVFLVKCNDKPSIKECPIIIEVECDSIMSDIPSFYDKSPKEGLMEALEYYDVKHKEVVYAQAILETGHFKSNICNNYNNLFGLYNSRTKDYYKFDSWIESIKGYKDMIQYKYDENNFNSYYDFLDNLGYAEDKEYTNKLKRIVKREFKNYDESILVN